MSSTITITLTNEQASTLANLASTNANSCYEVACGNWGNPDEEEAASLYKRSDELFALAALLCPEVYSDMSRWSA